jgi:hypothetical protein
VQGLERGVQGGSLARGLEALAASAAREGGSAGSGGADGTGRARLRRVEETVQVHSLVGAEEEEGGRSWGRGRGEVGSREVGRWRPSQGVEEGVGGWVAAQGEGRGAPAAGQGRAAGQGKKFWLYSILETLTLH